MTIILDYWNRALHGKVQHDDDLVIMQDYMVLLLWGILSRNKSILFEGTVLNMAIARVSVGSCCQ